MEDYHHEVERIVRALCWLRKAMVEKLQREAQCYAAPWV